MNLKWRRTRCPNGLAKVYQLDSKKQLESTPSRQNEQPKGITHVHMHEYVSVCACVCVCVWQQWHMMRRRMPACVQYWAIIFCWMAAAHKCAHTYYLLALWSSHRRCRRRQFVFYVQQQRAVRELRQQHFSALTLSLWVEIFVAIIIIIIESQNY